MNDYIQRAGRIALDTARESARQTLSERDDAEHLRGFTSAADIALHCIQEMIDSFRKQMKGSGLNKADQATYVQLEELKSEIEADFEFYLQGAGDVARVPKVVVKGTVRPAEELQP